MNSRTENVYWIWCDVDPDVVGLDVLAEVKPNEPLRRCVMVTCDMLLTPPIALLEDENGQHWNVQVPQMWVITSDDPHAS